VTKVLYIEDNDDDNVYMLKMRLELLGDFEVLAAEDGQKGCEMAATRAAGHHPDGISKCPSPFDRVGIGVA
jgi:CheY-like chemotaxis protein